MLARADCRGVRIDYIASFYVPFMFVCVFPTAVASDMSADLPPQQESTNTPTTLQVSILSFFKLITFTQNAESD